MLQEVQAPSYSRYSVHEGGKVVSLMHGRLYTQEVPPVPISVRGSVDLRANDPIGNRTRNLPSCSAVAQPTAS
jgi:hypothetical protein